MPSLSSLPGTGPVLPAGAQKVSLKQIDLNTNSSTKKEDVTVLADTQRMYADPVLVDSQAASSGVSATCSASGLLKGSEPEPDPVEYDEEGAPIDPVGWVCTDTEVTYEVGKYVTWSANYSYYVSES